jgi:hypothetical protein
VTKQQATVPRPVSTTADRRARAQQRSHENFLLAERQIRGKAFVYKSTGGRSRPPGLGGRLENQNGEHRGHRRDGHRRPVPGGHRRTLCRRGALNKGALEWAAKTASACRCAVEVWGFMPDPETDEMLRQADSRR